jgi:hypothetical protein
MRERERMWKDKLYMRFLPLHDEESAVTLSRVRGRMEDEGTLGAVLLGARECSRERFLSIMLRCGTLPFLLHWEGKECGLAWFVVFGEKSCFGNCCIFREFWGKERTTQMARGVYTHILTCRDGQGYMFDCVASLSAVSNPLSWRGAMRAGAKKIGVIPNGLFCADTNESVDAVFTVATREIMRMDA